MAHRIRRAISPAQTVRLGLTESARCGTTLLADIVQPGWTAGAVSGAAVHGTAFLELISPTSAGLAGALQSARDHYLCFPPDLSGQGQGTPGGWQAGLCPHAPYSAHPDLVRQAAALAASLGIPVSLHLAESRDELELLRSGTGPLRELLEQLGAWEPGGIPAGTRPLDYLRLLAAVPRTLIVHGNYLDDEEIAFLARHSGTMSAVYCPRTHAFFRHASYPLEQMLSAGVTVALGTDSRASAPDLSILAEMRLVARRHPAVPGATVLRLGTLGGAAALGRANEFGTLEPGKPANLTLVALPDRETADPHDLLLRSDCPVVGRYLHGRPCFTAAVA